MALSLRVYEQITHGTDQNTRFRAIAEAIDFFDRLIDRATPATRADVHTSELRLRKEIEQIRLQTEQVRGETERVRLECKSLEVCLVQAVRRQTIWIIGAVGTSIAAIRLLEYLLS